MLLIFITLIIWFAVSPFIIDNKKILKIVKSLIIILIIILVVFLSLPPYPGSYNADSFIGHCIESDQVKIIRAIDECVAEKKTDRIQINDLDL